MAYKLYTDNNYVVIENTSNGNRIEFCEPKSNVIGAVQDNELKLKLFSNPNFNEEYAFSTLVDSGGSAWASVSALQTWIRQNTGFNTASGGSGAWGGITGTITDQTDLVNYVASISGSASTGTGTELSLSNVSGTYYNMSSADNNTTYTFNDGTKVLGGISLKLVNCESLPVVTGATRIFKGDEFVANKNIYLVARYNGNRVEYWFEGSFEAIENLVGLPYGIISAESTSPSDTFLGSPSVYKSSSGRYYMSHDYFGSGTDYDTTSVYYSDDISQGFTKMQDITDMFWGSLFEYDSEMYIVGTSKGGQTGQSDITISKLDSNFNTWSAAVSVVSSPSATVKWHTTYQKVIIKDGYLVKSFEKMNTASAWAGFFTATIVVADVTDLLDSANWSALNDVTFDGTAFANSLIFTNTSNIKTPGGETASKGFLEGSIIEKADDNLRLMLRLEQTLASNHAVYLEVSWNSGTPTSSTISSTHNFIDLPGGHVKFSSVYDATSDRVWSITNLNRFKYESDNRIEAYLISSDDEGATWDVHQKVLGWSPSVEWEAEIAQFGVQYASFIIDGDDLIIADRTSNGNAADHHDSNLITITAVQDFRDIPVIAFEDGCLVIDENSERIEDSNGIAVIHDQSAYFNSPFTLKADNANKVSWSSGLNFTGSEFLKTAYDRLLTLNYNDGISMFVVVENIQAITGERIISNTDNTNVEPTPSSGGWWLAANTGLAIEQYRGNYSDVSLGNDYIIASSFDFANDHIYNYLNGANRGEPDTMTNTSWDTDHMVMSGSYSGNNYRGLNIGYRNVGTPLYFEGLIKAIHIFPEYMTPAEMVAYMTTLNGIYSIY